MIVRLAYIDRQVSICRKHYDDPPEECPPLGPVQDARDIEGCEYCLPDPEPEPCEPCGGAGALRRRGGAVRARVPALRRDR